jgi:hypothetical protein
MSNVVKFPASAATAPTVAEMVKYFPRTSWTICRLLIQSLRRGQMVGLTLALEIAGTTFQQIAAGMIAREVSITPK